MVVSCKKCESVKNIKNGIVGGKQRYKCKDCGYSFREGDERTSERAAAKKALCVLLYALCKGSFRRIGKLMNIHHSQVYDWVREFGKALPAPEVPGDIIEMEFDEMWHFVGSKKTNFGSSKPLIVAHGKPWPGCSGVVILQLSDDSTIK